METALDSSGGEGGRMNAGCMAANFRWIWSTELGGANTPLDTFSA
jgi:hypothetical protein